MVDTIDTNKTNNLGSTYIIDKANNKTDKIGEGLNNSDDPSISIADIDKANNLDIADIVNKADNKTNEISRGLNNRDW